MNTEQNTQIPEEIWKTEVYGLTNFKLFENIVVGSLIIPQDAIDENGTTTTVNKSVRLAMPADVAAALCRELHTALTAPPVQQ